MANGRQTAERQTMTEKIRELEAQIERLKRIAIDLKVDINIRDAKIRELESELLNERRQVRSLEVGTQTMEKLRIIDDEDSCDPRATGEYNVNRWRNVR